MRADDVPLRSPAAEPWHRSPLVSPLRGPYHLFRSLLFDPIVAGRRLRALPHFVTNAIAYARANGNSRFKLRVADAMFASADRFATAGVADRAYFLQDLWAARRVRDSGVTTHVDVGSRVDGFVAHLLPFCIVTYVDIRPLTIEVPGLEFVEGSIVDLPFYDGTVPSLSCLHVIEHIGLGRYGDPIDPDGHLRSARELARVLAPGGRLLLGTPVGRERLCFDAHRVFDPRTIVDAFRPLRLEQFNLIDDDANRIDHDAPLEAASRCTYGCGLFTFTKDVS